MNKAGYIFLITVAVALIAYNATMIDFQDPFEGDSMIALIGIVAPLCAIILLLIYMTSKRIQEKIKEN